jgi:hypothetical protein
MRQQEKLTIKDLSGHLFWDTDRDRLDVDENFRFILGRVLEYGLMNDWMLLYKHFGIKKIASEAKEMRSLDDKSLHFIAHLSDSKLEEFKCYTYKQSIPKHWNF